MQTENIATCNSATWNGALHKKSTTEKSATWRDYYTKKCYLEMVQYEKSGTWKERNVKKVQYEKIWIDTVKYGKSAQE